MDREALLEAVGTLQAEMNMMRQIVKMLLVQHALSRRPDDPPAALDDLKDTLTSAFADPASNAEHWQNDVATDCLMDQIEGAKIILGVLSEPSSTPPDVKHITSR